MSDDKTMDQVVNVLDRHHLGRPDGGVAVGAWVQCSCGEFMAGHSRWHAQIQAQRHVARALADEGLITPATLHKEYGEGPLIDGEPSHWPIPVHDCAACEEAAPDHFRWVTSWLRTTPHEKESSTMSDTPKPTTVKVVVPNDAPGIGIGHAIIVVVGDEFYSNGRDELVVQAGGEDVAIFATGQWRYAQIIGESEHK